MRFPSFAFAAVAGLWQQPLASEEETVTSTRHIHITKAVTDAASAIYAVRVGTSTMYMEYLPATLVAKSVPWQALRTGHLELRSEGESTSTMHIKVTQTVAQVQATVFASRVGTSVSTITDVPQSLKEEAAEDAAELSSSHSAAAISSAKSEALAHSTVAMLAGTTSSTTQTSSTLPSSTQPEATPLPGYTNSSSSSTSAQVPVVSSSTVIPIGLELRSNAGAATNVQQQETSTEAPATVVAVIYGSSTSIMTSVPPTLLAAIASSQATSTSQSSISTATISSATSIQTTETALSVDTNAAQVKSTQTALIQASTYSVEAAVTSSADSASSTTAKGCFGNCPSQPTVVLFPSSSKTSSTTSTSSSAFVISNKVYTVPITTSTASGSSVHTTAGSSAAETSAAASFPSAYGSQSSASAAADIAADNAAGASGGDSGSFKLSKGGFAAIISVVSIGVGLGIIFLILFVIAKRRQWNVRQSIAHASRRLTGRFSSHPNKRALHSEKEPTLPIIEPRQPLGPRPAPSSRRTQQGFANIDATLQTNYRGVETVGRSASRGPEAWRREMAKGRQQQQQQQMRSQSQRKKPELRVDTGVAARGMEEGRLTEQKKRSRGDWRDLFRAL